MRRALGLLLAALLWVPGLLASPAQVAARPKAPPATATATGTGGAVASVDPYASRAAINVLKRGGNAIDAAVTAAAVLGVVEPYSCGIGGGGFMVVYLAGDRSVHTVDAREAAPMAFHPEVFIDPETGEPFPFAERVTSGLGVGVPGTLRGWKVALDRWGTRSLKASLRPARTLANKGFVVDETLEAQTEANAERFSQFTSTRQLFLPGGEPRPAGTVFKNKDLARTYGLIMRRGLEPFYDGAIAADIVTTVQDPPLAPDATFNVRPGLMERGDLAAYEAPLRPPTRVGYRGLDVFGMGPPSSGGSTVGEALNILEGFDMASAPREEALHNYLEASALSFADRNAYLGDPDQVDVPLEGLLSDSFAAERRDLIGPSAMSRPTAPGDPFPHQGSSSPSGARSGRTAAAQGSSTTHLTVSDKWGNVVSYTFTIEQIGGSGIVVPERGFLLNNELTDFNPVPPHPNAPDAGKRPRSSMSPTIVLNDGVPVVAVGSPGGATIITIVLQILVNHLDFGMNLPDAIAAPRLAQLNLAQTFVEPEFVSTPEFAALQARGHDLATIAEIGAATGIAFLPGGRVQAAVEPVRRGGGDARVQSPE